MSQLCDNDCVQVPRQRYSKRVYTDKGSRFHAAVEWVGRQDGERDVYVKFDEQKCRVTLVSKQGSTLRQLNLINIGRATGRTSIVKMTNNDRQRPMVLVKIPREYDMASGVL